MLERRLLLVNLLDRLIFVVVASLFLGLWRWCDAIVVAIRAFVVARQLALLGCSGSCGSIEFDCFWLGRWFLGLDSILGR